MQRDRPIVLSIAGFDPSGGAGVLADIKTLEQLNVQGMAVLTANTIQTENQFIRMEWLPLDFMLESIQSLLLNYTVRVVKIGIVRDFHFLRSIVECVAKLNKEAFIVWDPVLESSSGFTFFSAMDIQLLIELSDKIDLITPNYNEYLTLRAALRLEDFKNVLIKGGHRKEKVGTDILQQGNKEFTFPPTTAVLYGKHGSGCVLSSAISAYLACGKPMQDACRLGKQYVEQFLNSNPGLLGYHHEIQQNTIYFSRENLGRTREEH